MSPVRPAIALVAAAAVMAVIALPVEPAAAQGAPGLPNAQGDFDRDGITNEIECSGALSHFLLNGSFETPDIPAGSSRILTPAATFEWQTTASDGKVELWDNHADGGSVPNPLPAVDGAQIAELNATVPSALFQDITTTPGDVYVWALSHHRRRRRAPPPPPRHRPAHLRPRHRRRRSRVRARCPRPATSHRLRSGWRSARSSSEASPSSLVRGSGPGASART